MSMRILACAIMLLCGVAHAADGYDSREIFRRLDQNGDRALQFEEIRAARAALFQRLDTSRDGFLETAEIPDPDHPGSELAFLGGIGTVIERMDQSGDGRVSRGEFTSFLPDRVVQADTNGDGKLSVRELRTIRR